MIHLGRFFWGKTWEIWIGDDKWCSTGLVWKLRVTPLRGANWSDGESLVGTTKISGHGTINHKFCRISIGNGRHKSPVFHMAMDQYHSIPMKIPFLGGWTSINPSYFDLNYRGTRFWHTAISHKLPIYSYHFFRWDLVWLHCASGSRERRDSARWQGRTCTDHPQPLRCCIRWLWDDGRHGWLRNDVGGIDEYWYMCDICLIYIYIYVCLFDICLRYVWDMFEICLIYVCVCLIYVDICLICVCVCLIYVDICLIYIYMCVCVWYMLIYVWYMCDHNLTTMNLSTSWVSGCVEIRCFWARMIHHHFCLMVGHLVIYPLVNSHITMENHHV